MTTVDKVMSLVFLGGIADSGKSALLREIDRVGNSKNIAKCEREGIERNEKDDEVRLIYISDSFKQPLNAPDGPLSAAVIYVDWKSKESVAIDDLCKKIVNWRDGTMNRTLIINSHFATYSPGGFMMGLDPPNLRRICVACNLCGENKQEKAGVILVDIGVSDVLQRREAQWKVNPEVFSTGTGLLQDLEFNRLYALQYYNTLARILDDDEDERVFYHRALVDWRNVKDLNKELSEVPEFREMSEKVIQFLIWKEILPSA